MSIKISKALSQFLNKLGPAPVSTQLEVALPDRVRYVAQDADGAWYGYAEHPLFDGVAGAWLPEVDGESCFLCWGQINRSFSSTLEQVRP
jgi:hypothetical protein